VVVSAKDTAANRMVAVKKVPNAFHVSAAVCVCVCVCVCVWRDGKSAREGKVEHPYRRRLSPHCPPSIPPPPTPPSSHPATHRTWWTPSASCARSSCCGTSTG
jgi:hypothetical protein